MIKIFTSLFYLLLITFTVTSQNPVSILEITDKSVTADSFTDKEIIIKNGCELHLTSASQPLNNSIVRLSGEDAWLFIDNIKPSVVLSGILPKVFVNDKAAANRVNVRIAVYKHGTVIIPHSSTVKPLTIYTEPEFMGDSAKYTLFTRFTSLGSFDNKAKSFRLKRGYMATLANTSDGTGYSRVFIADDSDIIVPVMPKELNGTVSFIRVMNWEWVTKKGWCGTGSGGTTDGNKVNATWFYSWSADQNSSSNLEYVPIRQNAGWPGWTEIYGKSYVTHLLGYNEPDHVEQSNVTVAQAIQQWPDMLKSGLRLGSPACTNFSWLYQFMDSCKARNYRVDYVAVHAYWGGKTPQNWYNDLKYIHERTGRPLWITEWNNGANWTNESWPTDWASQQNKQLNDLKAILTVLDTAHFIERYSIYNWVEDKRAMLLNGNLTPAGQYYADNKSRMAFDRANEVIPVYNLGGKPSLSLAFGSQTLSLNIVDPNGEFFTGFILEKQIDNNEFVVIKDSESKTLKTVVDTLDLNAGNKVRYRVRTKLPDGSLSTFSNETGFDVSSGNDFQFGNVLLANTGWNPVFFKVPYTEIPTIIVGSPTNKNISALLVTRAKLVTYATRFNIQLAPWSYQKISSLAKEETIPYLVMKPGEYNFGGLIAKAGKSVVGPNWTAVNFDTPFSSVPVVFTSQLSSLSSNATTVRIRNVTKSGFEAKIMKESAIATTIPSETVSYFAALPGKGVLQNNKIIVGKTADNVVSSVYNTINYGDSITDPVFIAQMQTCNDDTVTAYLRTLYLSNKFSNVVKQRERSTGATYMAKESAGWLVIDQVENISNINKIKQSENLEVFPNPATENIKIKGVEDKLSVDIYNAFGAFVKSVMVNSGTIDISDLKPGYYLLKLDNIYRGRFLKK